MKIVSIKGSQILDSRGIPTVACSIKTGTGSFSAMVPSGTSTGQYEALELRDAGKEFDGKGVLKAVQNVNGPIAKALVGKLFQTQRDVDTALIKLDGTKNKSRLGGNAILAVSMAVCRAGADERRMNLYEYIGQLAGNKSFVLPVPQLNVMNGGYHVGLKNDIQESMFFPSGAKSFSEALRIGTEAYHCLKKILLQKYGVSATLIGAEGGFVPEAVKKQADRMTLIQQAAEETGYAKKIDFAIDAAASEFYANGSYQIGSQKFSSESLVEYYSEFISNYSIVSLEDAFSDDDWSGWTALTKKLGSQLQIVGDDLLVTNPERIKRAISEKACNSLLLKVNQIGTVSESIDAFLIAKNAGWTTVVSHRSGETEDSFIADLVVGLGCGQSKFGAPARSERTAKYNRLLQIEETLGSKARFGSITAR
ncbi:MAG: phosphopyruvate hydratase [Candidatus Diapherotrites archaeon]|uniref:Enolase n=1 Tax=Candidatus Iainarchaeum sp. TaxID=3101447 RepID=A0A8T4LFE1_9ARCH|nr:phosphopyruvate hydratase [Candidatus Diapherotrites archaeon]